MSGLLVHYEHEAALAIQTHAMAARVKDDRYARVQAAQKEREELNHPACSLPLGERAAKLTEIEHALPLLQTELRLSQQRVEQTEVRITETRLQLHNSRIVARNLSNRIARAEQELRNLVSSELPPPSIALFRVRAERDLAALHKQYTQLVGEVETPLEAA